MAVQLELKINQQELDSFDKAKAIPVALQLLKQANERFAQGEFDIADMLLMKAQVVFESEGEIEGLIKVLLLQGTIKRDQGDLQFALETFRKAREFALTLGDTLAEADALNLEASVLSYQGLDIQAIQSLKQALELLKDSSQTEKIMNLNCNVGSIYTYMGNYSQALNFLTQAYDHSHKLDKSNRGKAVLLSQLGALYFAIGENDKAIDFQLQAREVCRELGDIYTESAVLNNLAQLRLIKGQVIEARDLYVEALKISNRSGNSLYDIDNLLGLGAVYKRQNDYAKANDFYAQALAIAESSGKLDVTVEILLSLGSSYSELQMFAEAEQTLADALALATELEHPKSTYEAHSLLAELYEKRAELGKALYHHKEFHRVEKLIFNEEADKRTKQLSMQFEVERSRHEAEEYRLRTEIAQKARLEAETVVTARTRELEEAHLEVVTRLAVAAEYRDDDTGEHTKRVGRNAAAIAHYLGWSQEDVKLLFTAARLHDVGKIGVPDAILLKPGKLTNEEFEIIRQHTTIGARILANGQTQLLKLAEEIAQYHHERWDGNGYPFKLAGNAIPIAARIVSVADVLDALSQERPYKRAWSLEETLAEIKRQSGKQFDPVIVEACLAVFGKEEGISHLETVDSWQNTTFKLDVLNAKKTSSFSGSNELFQTIERYEKLLESKEKQIDQLQQEKNTAKQDLQHLAFTDALTHLGNRRAFEQDLESALLRPDKGHEVMVVTLDLDGLKQLNDALGHEQGDRLLSLFAQIIRDEFSVFGKVYRTGGDEFAGLVAQADLPKFSHIQNVVDSAIAKVREQHFPDVCVSMGLATYPLEAQSQGELVRLSDQRMYEHKEKKRSKARVLARASAL